VANRSLKRVQVENDLVGTVLFLASPESDFMTGQLLNVDGGANFIG
jgi:3-oxoacyl-[acyl-carrier protein] reductase